MRQTDGQTDGQTDRANRAQQSSRSAMLKGKLTCSYFFSEIVPVACTFSSNHVRLSRRY